MKTFFPLDEGWAESNENIAVQTWLIKLEAALAADATL